MQPARAQESFSMRQASDSLADVHRQCFDSLRKSVKTVAETLHISEVTSDKLNDQSERLLKIKSDTDKIEQNLNSTEILLNGMKSWWHSVSQVFSNPPVTSNEIPEKSNKGVVAVKESNPTAYMPKSKPLNTTIHKNASFEQQLDANLDELSDMLGSLHSQASEMNNSLNQQNLLLNELHGKVENNNSRIVAQRKQVDTLLRR